MRSKLDSNPLIKFRRFLSKLEFKKLLQISLQYSFSRLKNIGYDLSKDPTVVKVNIVETSDDLDRLNKIWAYEKEHNVKIF